MRDSPIETKWYKRGYMRGEGWVQWDHMVRQICEVRGMGCVQWWLRKHPWDG